MVIFSISKNVNKSKVILDQSWLFIMELESSKNKAKKVIKKATEETIKFYKKILIIVFVLIVIYTVVVSIFAFISTGTAFLTNVATISVGGFWAFFLGYFGWRMGQIIEEYFKTMRH